MGIEETDIIIIVHDPLLENWGCYGIQASELVCTIKEVKLNICSHDRALILICF